MMEYAIDPALMPAEGSEEIAPRQPVDSLDEPREKRRAGSTVESEDLEEQDEPVEPVEVPQYRPDRPVRKATKRQRLAKPAPEEEEEEDQLSYYDEPAAPRRATGRPNVIRKGKGRALPVKPIRLVIDLTVEVWLIMSSLLIYLTHIFRSMKKLRNFPLYLSPR
jgi:hypothetical protein